MESQYEVLTVHGTPVVEGIAYAPSRWVRRPVLPPVTAPDLPEDERPAAISQFESAAAQVAEGLMRRAEKANGDSAAVLYMTAGMATDKSWMRAVRESIQSGVPPVQATIAATESFVVTFEKAGGLLADRTADLRDIRDRVIARIQGNPEPGVPLVDHPIVLLADDLPPSDAAALDPDNCAALVTIAGGPTSHTSIIARQLGIPCIVAARQLDSIQDNTPVLVDANIGVIQTGVSEQEARNRVTADQDRLRQIRAWQGPAKTKDGVGVTLLANVQDGLSAQKAASESGVQGVGLFRTELLFLDTSTEPSVERQAEEYAAVFRAFPGRKVVIRTLDAGSDKPVPFATLSAEANPALGVRGIRISGPNPNLLPRQLDAIASAQGECPETEVWVMAPMISTIPEAEWFTGLCHERGLTAGIMVEVPAAVVLIDRMLEIVDFVSIGTNDLNQYTMAADRMSPHLAEYTDPWQPAVLHLIRQTARAGLDHTKAVGVCGEAAADPLLACVMVGMGVSSLSMAAGAIPAVGAALERHTLEECTRAADAAVRGRDAKDARYLAREALANNSQKTNLLRE